MANTWMEILAKIILHSHLASWQAVVSHTALNHPIPTLLAHLAKGNVSFCHHISIQVLAILARWHVWANYDNLRLVS
jgi:hypothetical protein